MLIKKESAWRSRDFRLWWIGQLISITGTQMQIVAVNWHVYLLTHSALALGLLGIARFIPIMFFAFPAGIVADRYNRKHINIAVQFVLGLLSFFLALATLNNAVSILIIYFISLLATSVSAFDVPTSSTLVPNLVTREELPNAMSLMITMRQIATIVGPALAGFLIASIGVGPIYLFDAFSYGAVVVALLFITSSGKVIGAGAKVSFLSVKEGIQFIKSKTIIWSTMFLDFFSTFFAGAMTLLPIFAKDILHVGPQALGLLYAAPSIGAVIAGVTMVRSGAISKQGEKLLFAIIFYALGTILFGFSDIFLLSFIGLCVVGVGDSVSTIIRNTIRQINTPDNLRGRMTSINMIFFMGGPQLGEFESGILAAAIGAPWAVVFGGIGTLIVLGVIVTAVPVLRTYDK